MNAKYIYALLLNWNLLVDPGFIPVALSFNPSFEKERNNIIDMIIIPIINIGRAGMLREVKVGNQDSWGNISVPLVDAIPFLLQGPNIR